MLKKLSEPPKVDKDFFNQIEEPKLSIVEEDDENEKDIQNEKIDINVEETIEVPNLEEDERKQKRIEL
jgi:hypothetical protein